jgi:hypothetical protein
VTQQSEDQNMVPGTACTADMGSRVIHPGGSTDIGSTGPNLGAPVVCASDVWLCSDQDPMQMLVRYSYRRLEESCAALHGAVHRDA